MNEALKQKTDYTIERVTSMIINNISPEEVVAGDLFRKGITEQDYFKMKGLLGIPDPTFLKIANHLRDNWRHHVKI